jgi:hypothetical protein
VPVISHQGLNFLVSKNALSSMGKSLWQRLMHLWFKLLDHEPNGEVLVAVEDLSRVHAVDLQAPFVDLNDLVPEVAELDVAVILSEVVDGLFSDDGFDEIVPIADQNSWYHLNDDQSHVLFK